jgi:hypothetical protein
MNCAIHTDTPAAAFCRTCGKALCENCKRDVMGAIYCEPCIAARLQGSVPGVTTAIPVPPIPGTPSPALAALLGFIPGVGAMYNGQFVKAFVHVVIFAMLIVLSKEVFGLFGLLIGFFVMYMVFEAHQTAKARQVGMPSPDFLGLDHLFGIHENEPHVPRPVASAQSVPGQAPRQPVAHDKPPAGAIVLVALGVFFLLGNLGMLHTRRMWPLILIGFGLWIAYQRSTSRG